MQSAPLRVVLLTPPGRGAVATVRVEGPAACERVDSHFRPASKRPIAELSTDRLAYGRFQLGTEVYDEVIVRRPEKDIVEIHCHGGPAVVERLIEVLTVEDGERLPAKDWLQATHTSPIVAAAHAALGNTTTLRAAAILLDQYHGALDRALEETLDQLRRKHVDAAADHIRQLLAIAPCGCHLQQPWPVVLAGRPNVGKSSLMNALVGYSRAIVHETPGTTRDLVTAKTSLSGWPVEFCDTAGLRATNQSIEQQGIGLTHRQLVSAALVLLVFDATRPWSEADANLCQLCPNALLVFNKIDLGEASVDSRPAGQAVSAVKGHGIDRLIETIADRLVPCPPAPQQAVPFLDEHITALRAAADAIVSGDTDVAVNCITGLLRSPRQTESSRT